MSVSIRIYTQFGKEHVYTFNGYSTLNNTLSIYSNKDSDTCIKNFKGVVESNQPCNVHISDTSNCINTTTECHIEGATLSESNEILYKLATTSFTSHRR